MASLALVGPFAEAAFQASKTSLVEVTVDGNGAGVTNSASNRDLAVFTSVFGGGNPAPASSGEKELTTMYPTRSGPSASDAIVRFQAQGGVVEITCAAGYVNGAGLATSEEYYQRAQVTLDSLPAGSKKVWAFYDGNVGSGSAINSVPHFNQASAGIGNPDIANPRITSTLGLEKLCDGTTKYVESENFDVLTIGADTDDGAVAPASPTPLSKARDTAGAYKTTSATSITFDTYVPMDATDDTKGRIALALGFVVDVGADDVLDDTSTDVGIEAWIYSKPWWAIADADPDSAPNYDEVHSLLPTCAGSETSSDEPCVMNGSGIFQANGTTRLDTGYSAVLTRLGDESGFEARLDLAPTAPIGSSGFAIPASSVANIAVSWPTSGTSLGLNFGPDQIDFSTANASSPVLVDPSADASATNKWLIEESGGRVVTTLIGIAKTTSGGISRDSWWPQCNVSFNDDGSVEDQNDNCGSSMTSAVTTNHMVFSSVPAQLIMNVAPAQAALAGALVSTNGQGFAFGSETFEGVSFQFAVAGPSFDASGNSRSTDGFYYVCVPASYLSGTFSTSAAEAAANWQGTRDGSSVGSTFATGTCGTGDTGLVASLSQFGYSAPVFRLVPPAVAAAPAPMVSNPFIFPTITGYSSRSISSGDEVTISGTKFDVITECTIGGVAAEITAQDSASLTVVVPEGLDAGLATLVLKLRQGSLFQPNAFNVVAKKTPVVQASLTNAGSFNGYVAVYAKGLKGKILAWKIAGKWFKTTVTSDYQVFQRRTAAVGIDVDVHLYIDGEKQLTKTVTTR
jgi:hypothetical protein